MQEYFSGIFRGRATNSLISYCAMIVFQCCCKNKNMVLCAIEEMRQLLFYSSFFASLCIVGLPGSFFSSAYTRVVFLLGVGRWACKNCIHFTLSFLLTAAARRRFCVIHSAVVNEPARQCSMPSNSFTKHNCFVLAAIIFSQ